MWGVATPVIVWFSQRKRSLHLAFQALQAGIYQAIAVIAYFIGMGLYMLSVFGMMAALIVGSALVPETQTEMPPFVGILFFVVMALFGMLWLVAMVATPLYYILSAVGAIRTLRGKEFKYPLIGRMIERKMDYSVEPVKQKMDGSYVRDQS